MKKFVLGGFYSMIITSFGVRISIPRSDYSLLIDTSIVSTLVSSGLKWNSFTRSILPWYHYLHIEFRYLSILFKATIAAASIHDNPVLLFLYHEKLLS